MPIRSLVLISSFCAASLYACTPTAESATLKVISTNHYCTESLDVRGCNAGRVALKLQGSTTCKDAAPLEVSCSVDLRFKTKNYPDGIIQHFESTEPLTFETGDVEQKRYFSWSRLIDTARKVEVAKSECHFAAMATRTPDASNDDETVEDETEMEDNDDTSSDDAYELKLLKEQNRAKELEIETLKLKLKLKELESGSQP